MISCVQCILHTYTKKQALNWKRQLCHKIRTKPTFFRICITYGLFGAAAMIRVVAFGEKNASSYIDSSNGYSSTQSDLSDSTNTNDAGNIINPMIHNNNSSIKQLTLTLVICIICDILVSQLIRLVLHKKFITRRSTNTNLTTPVHKLLKQFFLAYVSVIAVLFTVFILFPRMLACSFVFTALNTLLIYQKRIASSHSSHPRSSPSPSSSQIPQDLYDQFRQRMQDLLAGNFQRFISNREGEEQQHHHPGEMPSDDEIDDNINDNDNTQEVFSNSDSDHNNTNNDSDSDNDLTDNSRVLLSFRRRHQQALNSHLSRMNVNRRNNNNNNQLNPPQANRLFDELIDEALQQQQFQQQYFLIAKQVIQLSINKYLLIYDTSSTRLACIYTTSGMLLNKIKLSKQATILKYYPSQSLGALFDDEHSTIKLFTINQTANSLVILRDLKCRRIANTNDIIFHETNLKYVYQSNLFASADDLYFADALSEHTGQLPQLEYNHSALQTYSTLDDQDYVVMSNQNTLIIHVIISQVQYTPNLGENSLDIHKAIQENTAENGRNRINRDTRNINDSNSIHGNRNTTHRQRQINGVQSGSGIVRNNGCSNNNNNTGNTQNIIPSNDAFAQWETMLESERAQQQQIYNQQNSNNNSNLTSPSTAASSNQPSNLTNNKYLIQRRTSKETFNQPILQVHLINHRQLIIQCQNACYLYSLGARCIIKELEFNCPLNGKYLKISNILLNSQDSPLERFTKLQAKVVQVTQQRIEEQFTGITNQLSPFSDELMELCKPLLLQQALSTACYHQQSNSLKVFVPDRRDSGKISNQQYGYDIFKRGLTSVNMSDLD